MVPFRYRDRTEAGRYLAESLVEYAGDAKVIVLALPRGGVPVAFEIATALHAPLDVYVVRKIGVPGHEELAMGATAGDGTVVLDERLVDGLGITREAFNAGVRRELTELHRRESVYRDGRPEPDLSGKTVIVVDDGLATGSTMRAAVTALRRRNPASIVVAVPTAAKRTCAELARVADRVVCPSTPEPFQAVGLYYDDFRQTTDDEVRALLRRAADMEAKRWRVA
jgi:predicted phosphoribosyltransferase